MTDKKAEIVEELVANFGRPRQAGKDLSKEDLTALIAALSSSSPATLTSVLLDEAKTIDGPSLISLLRALAVNKTVTAFSIPSGCALGTDVVQGFENMLEQNVTLRELSFHQSKSTAEALKRISTAARKNKNLVKLCCRGSEIGPEGADALNHAIMKNSQLRHLDVQWGRICAPGVARLASSLAKNTALVVLDLRGNQLRDEGARSIAAALEKNSTLAELSVEENEIGPEGVAMLADVLLKNKFLRKLQLDGNVVGDGGAMALATLLEQGSALTEISLQENGIGTKGGIKLAQALGRNGTLRALNLDTNSVGDEGATKFGFYLEQNTALTYLNLRKNSVRSAGAIRIGQALAKNATLLQLNLQSNAIDSEAAVSIAAGLDKNSSLTHLLLGWNDIGDRGAYVLSPVIAKSGTLVHLSIQNNGIGPDGGIRIASGMERNWSIVQLFTQNNQFEADSDQRIATYLSRNNALLHLFETFRKGDIAVARQLFSSAPPDIHLHMCNKETILESACRSGNKKFVIFLVREFFVEKKTFPLLSGTPKLAEAEAALLHEALKEVGTSTPLWQVKNGDGETLLHWAVMNSENATKDGMVPIIQLLLASGCDPNAHSWTTGITPLLCSQSRAVASELLKSGADVGACDLRGCGVESHLSEGCLEFVKLVKQPMHDVVIGIHGGMGSRALSGTLHSAAGQLVQAAVTPECQLEAELKQGPWWTVTESAPKSLPIGCFPTVTLKVRSGEAVTERKVRLCDLERLSEAVLDRSDMVVVCALSTDGPEVNTADTWDALQAMVRKWLARAPRSSAVLAGLDSRGDSAVVRLLRQYKMKHITAADAVYHARRRSFHAYGEFGVAPLRTNLLRFLEHCLAFHTLRLSGAELGSWDGLCSPGAMLRPVAPLPDATEARSFVKVVVLGPPSSGKTSILEKLAYRKKSLFSPARRATAPVAVECTVGIDEVCLDLSRDVLTSVFDFSGALEYLPTNELFLSRHDTLYVVTVDVSEDISLQQFSHWLQFLNDHPRGPSDSCRLVVALTKIDKFCPHVTKDRKSAAAAAARQREEQFVACLREWPLLDKLPHEFVAVSAKTGENIDRLKEALRTHALALGATAVPPIFRHASDAAEALTAVSSETFFTSVDFKKSLPPNLLLELHGSDARLWNDLLEHLHDTGQIITDVDNFNFVCLRPALMAKAFGLFFAPSSHLEQLIGSRHGARADTVNYLDACARIAALPGLDQPKEKDFVMQLLEQQRFCYSPSAAAAAAASTTAATAAAPAAIAAAAAALAASRTVVFPSLRPTCDSIYTILREVQTRRAKVVRLMCLTWSCTVCQAYGRGPLPTDCCPSCCSRVPLRQGCTNDCPHCSNARGQETLPEHLRILEAGKDGTVFCTGVIPTTGRAARVAFSRSCLCGEKIPRTMQTLVEAINVHSAEHLRSPLALFSRVVTAASGHLAPEYQLYSNAAAFIDAYGNSVTIFLSTPSGEAPAQMANHALQFRIHVRGVVPLLWFETFPQLVALGSRELHCPVCASTPHGPFEPLRVIQDGPTTKLVCAKNHTLPVSGVLNA